MKTLFTIIKLQLNVNFGISAIKHKFKYEKKKLWEPLLIMLSIVVGVGVLLFLYIALLNGLFEAAVMLGQPEIILTMAFLAAQLLILFFGMLHIMGSFYFSNDLTMMAALPLKPYQLLGGKLAVIMVNEYLTAFPLLIPPIIIFGAGMQMGIAYWVKALFLLLLSPAIPLMISSIFMLVMMRVINLRRNKDLLAVIGGFAALLLSLGLNIFIQKMPQDGGADFYQSLLKSGSGLAELMSGRYPPALWATFGLSESGLAGIGYFLLFAALSAILLVAFGLLANKVFYKSMLAGQEFKRNRKSKSTIKPATAYKSSTPVFSMFIREWKLLLRTPVYAVNGLTGIIVGPFIVIVMFFTQNSGPNGQNFVDLLSGLDKPIYIWLGCTGVMLLTASLNVVASTAVSREAKTFWMAKMIPVSGRQQILAKFFQGVSVNLMNVFTTGVLLAIVLKISGLITILLMLLAVLCSVSIAALCLWVDVSKPKMIWNSEQEAMKQNVNGILGMIIAVFVVLVFAAAAVVPLLFGLPGWSSFLIVSTAAVIIDILSIYIMLTAAQRQYLRLEA